MDSITKNVIEKMESSFQLQESSQTVSTEKTLNELVITLRSLNFSILNLLKK